jgi:hypothetical protein
MKTRSQVLILATAAALGFAIGGFVLAAEVEPRTSDPARHSGPLPDDGKTMVTITEVPIP